MDALLLLELTEKLNDAIAALDAAVATDDPLALLDATDQVSEVLAEMDGGDTQAASSIPTVSSVEGQKRLASRASRIASLMAMNDQIRAIDPNEAWHPDNINNASDSELDDLQDKISAKLVDLGRAKPVEKEPQAFEHAGFNIYPMRMKSDGGSSIKWLVQSIDNRDRESRGERQVGGDSILDTREKAMQEAEFQAKQADDIAARQQQATIDSQAKAKADAEKQQEYSDIGEIDGETALARGRRVAALSSLVRFRGAEVTKKKMVDILVGEGATTSTEQEDRIKPMSRTAFNRATQREQDAHAEKVRNGGKVTVYYLGEYRVDKTQFDYANHLISKHSDGELAATDFAASAVDSGYHVKNPVTGADVPVESIEDAAEKYKAFMARSNADRPGGMDVYDSRTGLPVANIKADGTWTPVETREQAIARSEREIARMNAEVNGLSRQYSELLDGIISGQIDTFQDKGKLQELSDALDAAGGDSMPAGELRDLFEQAIRAAGIQQLKGYGYLQAA